MAATEHTDRFAALLGARRGCERADSSRPSPGPRRGAAVCSDCWNEPFQDPEAGRRVWRDHDGDCLRLGQEPNVVAAHYSDCEQRLVWRRDRWAGHAPGARSPPARRTPSCPERMKPGQRGWPRADHRRRPG